MVPRKGVGFHFHGMRLHESETAPSFSSQPGELVLQHWCYGYHLVHLHHLQPKIPLPAARLDHGTRKIGANWESHWEYEARPVRQRLLVDPTRLVTHSWVPAEKRR